MKISLKDLKRFKFPLTEEEQAILLNEITAFEKELREIRKHTRIIMEEGREVPIISIDEILGEEGES